MNDYTPNPCPRCGCTVECASAACYPTFLIIESDKDFRTRIINEYGKWGAFCTAVLESSGKDLDECGKHVNLERLVASLSKNSDQS